MTGEGQRMLQKQEGPLEQSLKNCRETGGFSQAGGRQSVLADGRHSCAGRLREMV